MENFGVKYGAPYKKARLTNEEVKAEQKDGEDYQDSKAR